MSAETDLAATLSSATGVTALVESRIYADLRLQHHEKPAIFYGRTSTDPLMSIHGTLLANRVRLDLVCVSETRAAAEALAEAAQSAVIGGGFVLESRAGDFIPETETPIVTLGIIHLS